MRAAHVGIGLTILIGSNSMAQTPSVAIGLDLNPRISFDQDGRSFFRWHDASGNFSRVRFAANFDNGLSVKVFQKLEKIDGDADSSTIDEAYVERPGDWRIGKQMLPFGSGRLMRDSCVAAKIDLELVFANLPISLALTDAGSGRQRGLVARFGDNVGISAALGRRFGINAASFTQLRSPDSPPGKDRGYGLLFGVDVTQQSGGWTASAEWIQMRNGETAADPDEDVLDALVSYQFPYGPLVKTEATAEIVRRRLHYQVSAEFPLQSNVFVAPSVRYYDGSGLIYSVVFRVRL